MNEPTTYPLVKPVYTVCIYEGETVQRRLRASAEVILQKIGVYVESRGMSVQLENTLSGKVCGLRVGTVMGSTWYDLERDDFDGDNLSSAATSRCVFVCLSEEVPAALTGIEPFTASVGLPEGAKTPTRMDRPPPKSSGVTPGMERLGLPVKDLAEVDPDLNTTLVVASEARVDSVVVAPPVTSAPSEQQLPPPVRVSKTPLKSAAAHGPPQARVDSVVVAPPVTSAPSEQQLPPPVRVSKTPLKSAAARGPLTTGTSGRTPGKENTNRAGGPSSTKPPRGPSALKTASVKPTLTAKRTTPAKKSKPSESKPKIIPSPPAVSTRKAAKKERKAAKTEDKENRISGGELSGGELSGGEMSGSERSDIEQSNGEHGGTGSEGAEYDGEKEAASVRCKIVESIRTVLDREDEAELNLDDESGGLDVLDQLLQSGDESDPSSEEELSDAADEYEGIMPPDDLDRCVSQWKYNITPSLVYCRTQKLNCQVPDRDMFPIPEILRNRLDTRKYKIVKKFFTATGFKMALKFKGTHATNFNDARKAVFKCLTDYMAKKLRGRYCTENIKMLGLSLFYHYQWLRKPSWTLTSTMQVPPHAFLHSCEQKARGCWTAFAYRQEGLAKKAAARAGQPAADRRRTPKKKNNIPPLKLSEVTGESMVQNNPQLTHVLDMLKVFMVKRDNDEALMDSELEREAELLAYTCPYRRALFTGGFRDYWSPAQQIREHGGVLYNRKAFLCEFREQRTKYPRYRSVGAEYDEEAFMYLLQKMFSVALLHYFETKPKGPAASVLYGAPVARVDGCAYTMDDFASMRLADWVLLCVQLMIHWSRRKATDMKWTPDCVKAFILTTKYGGATAAVNVCEETHGDTYRKAALITVRTEDGTSSTPCVPGEDSVHLVVHGQIAQCGSLLEAIHDSFCAHWVFDFPYKIELFAFFEMLESAYGFDRLTGPRLGPLKRKNLTPNATEMVLIVTENEFCKAAGATKRRAARYKRHDNLMLHALSPAVPQALIRVGAVLPDHNVNRGPSTREATVATVRHPAGLNPTLRTKVTSAQQANPASRVLWADNPEISEDEEDEDDGPMTSAQSERRQPRRPQTPHNIAATSKTLKRHRSGTPPAPARGRPAKARNTPVAAKRKTPAKPANRSGRRASDVSVSCSPTPSQRQPQQSPASKGSRTRNVPATDKVTKRRASPATKSTTSTRSRTNVPIAASNEPIKLRKRVCVDESSEHSSTSPSPRKQLKRQPLPEPRLRKFPPRNTTSSTPLDPLNLEPLIMEPLSQDPVNMPLSRKPPSGACGTSKSSVGNSSARAPSRVSRQPLGFAPSNYGRTSSTRIPSPKPRARQSPRINTRVDNSRRSRSASANVDDEGTGAIEGPIYRRADRPPKSYTNSYSHGRERDPDSNNTSDFSSSQD